MLTKQQISLLRNALSDFQALEFGADIVDKHWNAFFEAGIDVDLPFRAVSRSKEADDAQD